MKKIAISPDMAGDNATPLIEKTIADAPDGATIIFEQGTYHLARTVMICGKTNLTLDGRGATLAPYFSRQTGADDGAGVFELLDCKNLTIRGFTVQSAVPANTAGEVIGSTENYVDVRLNTDTPFKGDELIIDGMVFDEDWYPLGYHWAEAEFDPNQRMVIAGEVPCAAPKKLNCPHEMLDEKTVRVYTKLMKCYDMAKSVSTIKPGTKCNISHTYYGLVAFVFRQCDTLLIEDVTMANFAGFGFLILPHCHDFTFRRLKFKSPDRSRQPYALNSDGIHVTGLSGKLLIEDCELDCIGDDKLNVHTAANNVAAVEGDRLTLIHDKINGIVPKYWSAAGDSLRVYDPKTLELKGKVKVVAADCGDIIFEPHGVDIKVGDYVTNDKYYPDIVIRNCTCWRNRGRHLTLQSSNSLLIENCTFYNSSPWALYLSTAFEYWLEVGPLANVRVQNNLFKDCRQRDDDGRSTIFVRINGKSHQDIPPVHKNICIENNTFENTYGMPIRVHLTDGVTVQGNRFVNCRFEGERVEIQRCTNVICKNNQ